MSDSGRGGRAGSLAGALWSADGGYLQLACPSDLVENIAGHHRLADIPGNNWD